VKQDHIFLLNLLRQLVMITAPFLPVFRIREILARIRIIRSVPEKTDMDTYKCLWIFDIKVIFLVLLKCNKIQKCILPCENFNFVTKISRYFAIRNFAKFREIKKNYFAKYEINISRNFATEKFRQPP
jgi:hypothetical protein